VIPDKCPVIPTLTTVGDSEQSLCESLSVTPRVPHSRSHSPEVLEVPLRRTCLVIQGPPTASAAPSVRGTCKGQACSVCWVMTSHSVSFSVC
jgi:hypothetical protein